MGSSRGAAGRWTLGCLALLGLASDARAAELYLAGELGISANTGESGGFNSFSGTPNRGDDSDSSSVFGAALGLLIPLHAAVPWELPGGTELPGWNLRTELEWTGGRDAELVTQGAFPYRSSVKSWSGMGTLWLDMPLHDAVSRLFGRLPLLEPLSVYLGGGVGLASNDVSTSDNVSSGDDTSYNFAYQAGAGLGYELTEHVSLAFGYRYLDLGETELDLTSGPNSAGNFSLDLSAHEFTARLRVNFYSLPFARRRFEAR